MTATDFTTTLLVDKTPQQVFDAVNNVRGWWTEWLTGNTLALNDVFEVQFGDMHYSKHQITEFIPGQKVVWLTLDANLTFLQDPAEWVGTWIVFDISEQDGQTLLTFTHEGLASSFECFDVCSNAWGQYMRNSLYCLLTKGKGQPGFPPEEPCE